MAALLQPDCNAAVAYGKWWGSVWGTRHAWHPRHGTASHAPRGSSSGTVHPQLFNAAAHGGPPAATPAAASRGGSSSPILAPAACFVVISSYADGSLAADLAQAAQRPPLALCSLWSSVLSRRRGRPLAAGCTWGPSPLPELPWTSSSAPSSAF